MNELRVIYDTDSNLKLEKADPLRKIIDFVWIPFLNNLPENFGERFFEKSSHDGTQVKTHATTFKALEIFYNFDNKIHLKDNIKNPIIRAIDGIFTWIWQHIHNVKAIRNRLKIVARELYSALLYFLEMNDKNVSILSLGAGSARAPYEALQLFTKNNIKINSKVDLVLIDKNQEALNYSKYLSSKYSLPLNVSHLRIKCNVSEFPQFYDKKLDIIEAVGLFDYFNDEKASEKFKLIYDRLKEGGYFIVSNIMPNRERPFVEKIIKWRGLYYRRKEDLINLLLNGGFSKERIKIIIEPQDIHMIAVAQKSIHV